MSSGIVKIQVHPGYPADIQFGLEFSRVLRRPDIILSNATVCKHLVAEKLLLPLFSLNFAASTVSNISALVDLPTKRVINISTGH